MFEVWPRCWWIVHVKHPIPPRGFVAARRFKKVGTRRHFHRAVAMWAALFGPKKPENEHSIQVKFVPGWTAGFIEQRSMQMPSKWTSDTEEWENVSSLAWQGIIRSIEEALYCPETEVIQSKIRRFFSGVSFLTELLQKFRGLVFKKCLLRLYFLRGNILLFEGFSMKSPKGMPFCPSCDFQLLHHIINRTL